MLENEKINIFKQDHFGRGIAKINDMLIFIDGALPGEKCKIKITNQKKKFLEGKVIEVTEKSSDRINPKCPFYEECGGCHIMHQSREKQLFFKEEKVKELLERFAGISRDVVYPITYGKDFNYRNKIILRSNGNELGFYKEKTHDLVPINECCITDLKINDISKRINDYLKVNNNIQEVMIRSTSLNEVMLSIKGNINISNFINSFKDITSIYINDKFICGREYITENIFGLMFKIYPNSFFQVNYEIMEALYKKVQDFYKNKNYSTVLDLYCGCGTIGMLVSNYVENVIGVEVVESAVESALVCMKINDIKNISFKCGKVEDMINSFKNVDSIIVDPPRKGLDTHTINTILKLNPESIVYVSCDPVTLARDLKILSTDYDVVEVHPFDMFPNTYHVECVCVLKRKQTLEI